MSEPTKEEIEIFSQLIDKYRYDFTKLIFIIFPYGEKGHALEHMRPYDWQMEELEKISKHLQNPETRYETYRLIVSTGNGSGKTAFGAQIFLMLMYTQRLRARVTANTQPQLSSVVWPEYDKWFRYARYSEHFFEKFGTSIKAKNPELSDTWRLDAVTWSEQSPASISGLHNKGGACMYIFEEAPGIPAIIWQYAAGAFTETETIKIHLAFGNSDDPQSYFEQCMSSPLWNAVRIDTRTLPHIDKKQIEAWLTECGGDEDADDFRVRVRGLPRKSAADSIIHIDLVKEALERRKNFDRKLVIHLPVILGCDPAWTGGDETVIWLRQGHYLKILEKYKLDKAAGENHMLTFNKLCYYEKLERVDAVNIDQAEGTALYTMAINSGRTNWQLVSFAQSPNDQPESKDSEFANIRAQMYYELRDELARGAVIDIRDGLSAEEEKKWIDTIISHFTATRGTRHKVTGKKLAEPKLEVKKRILKSPDVADAAVLTFARPIYERLPEHAVGEGGALLPPFETGLEAWSMPEPDNPYDILDADYEELYS